LLRFNHGWSTVALPDKRWQLTALVSGGPDSVRGVGVVVSASPTRFAPLVVHWDGARWKQVRLPTSLPDAQVTASMYVADPERLVPQIQAASGGRLWLGDGDPSQPHQLLYYDGSWQVRSLADDSTTAANPIWLPDQAGGARAPWLAVPSGKDATSQGAVSQVAFGPAGAV